MAVQRALVCLAAIAMLFQLAMAANHTVGAPGGSWDTSTDLQAWAVSQTFSVGDNLSLFKYTTNHDVLEVTKANYDSCGTRKRYFICGTAGHCGQGMKLEVDTTAAAANSPKSPPRTPSGGSPSKIV
ncbi:hypothetical protein J1N35_041943 [Gossypium stocksii]|uniref:Phytocyanin domain-containing protein n=1 Tax=Gossypium stocksii TaxID=47602 RepID=A0A9D3UGI6_9ROSI|nr:hypothetical protein J1N35_041943 [Gossypium stocksii]